MNPKVLNAQALTTSVPPETIFLLGKLQQSGDYVFVLPMIDSSFSFSLEGHEDELRINGHRVRSIVSSDDRYQNALLVASGSNPFKLIHSCFQVVKDHLRTMNEYFAKGSFSLHHPPQRYTHGPGPAFVDYLGWCTWDAFYTKVSAGKVLQGLDSFHSKNLTPRFMILDDGWQETDVDVDSTDQWAGMLTSFGTKPSFAADSQVKDLKGLVCYVKEKCSIKHFLVWHTLTGYWRGVHIDSLVKFSSQVVFPRVSQSELRMSKRFMEVYMQGGKAASIGLVPPEHIDTFFREYHSFLAASGVDGVKVDAQSILPVRLTMSTLYSR
jgi:raffinose synthase